MNKLKLKSNLNEQDLMESALNMIASGIDSTIIVSFYALLHRWRIDKLSYYLNLLEETK